MSTTAIERLNAALSGRYRIERELGEGGMATVYLADDLKHERKVALKVLKPTLAAVVGAERFLAEIKTTANLQHPHILPLFDSGEADSFLFYVMPYVEGESLRERLDREHQLPVDDAVRIATNMAEALDYAHRQGVVHRDIKPANVLLQDGKPVISDFGIALAVGAAGGSRLTETGLSLGTPFYMSPEQATGDQNVGPATDTYALGCVLYEMLTGDPPYIGSTAQAVLGKIIQGAPVSVTEIRKAVPRHVDAALRRALEKLPADRFSGAQEFARALADKGFAHGELEGTVTPAGPSLWKPLAIGLGALALALGAVAGWALLRPSEAPISRYTIYVPVTQRVDGGFSDLTISSDGTHVVYVGAGEDGRQLWLRRRDQLEAAPIAGTSFASSPVFSPDGTRVVFAAGDGVIKTVSLTGEPPLTIVDESRLGFGLSWGPDGYIYAFRSGGLGRVSETGGELELFTTVDYARSERVHAWPQVLPSGRRMVFTVLHEPVADIGQYDIAVADMETGEHEVLVPGVFARYAASGHLIYLTQDGTLMAAPFDQDRMELGDAVALVEGVAVRLWGSAGLALSDDGTLVYRAGAVQAGGQIEFVWVTRSGQAVSVDPGYTFTQGDPNYGLRLSPDETRIVFNGSVDGNTEILIKHLPDGPEDRITFSEETETRPFWTPDGRLVSYFAGSSTMSGNSLWSSRADGTGAPVLVLDDERSLAQGSWSPDGEWLVIRSGATASDGLGGRDILAFRPGVDSVAAPLVASPDFNEGSPAVSPDGRWLAYNSNRTGRHEVFLRPFPDVESTRIPISRDGGVAPVWAKNGRELFFVGLDRALVATQLDPASGRVLAQETLFTLPAEVLTDTDLGGIYFYDVSADGERFLMARWYTRDIEDESSPGFVVVQNFFGELRQRVGN